MAVQVTNTYSFNVKRLSQMGGQNQPSGPTNSPYNGETCFVSASTQPNAMAVLTQFYGADLGPVSGGAMLVPGALTTMTGRLKEEPSWRSR